MQYQKIIFRCLSECKQDQEIIEFIAKIITQVQSGASIEDAILLVCNKSTKQNITDYHEDNMAVKLATSKKVILMDYRLRGYGYKRIRKLLTWRGIKNPKTNKPYSVTTIRQAVIIAEGLI